jgi:integrase
MRKGELLSLTWDAVDVTHGFIRLKQTKNGKARALPFNETLWALFSQLRTRPDTPWVFHDPAGHRWRDVRHAFDRACEAAGLTDFHFHDLRHTFASWLIMRGIPLVTVSNLLGHTSPTMTLRYAHLSPRHLTSAVRVLDPHSDSSLDSYLIIQPETRPEEVIASVRSEGDETLIRLERSGERGVVPKPGFEPGHPCGR